MPRISVPQFHYVKASKRSLGHRKLIFGVGVNDAWYEVQPIVDGNQQRCPFYNTWHSMLERCYSVKYQAKSTAYKGCTVAPELHSFMTFRIWMSEQGWEGKQLDKDIIKPGNKVYSTEYCCFVSPALNILLANTGAAKGEYPRGVHFSNAAGKFVARIGTNGKRKHLGYFDTPKEASEVYLKARYDYIMRTIVQQTDIRIIEGLSRHAELLSYAP